MPLLRGPFWSDEWTLVRIAEIGVAASQDKFDSELMDEVQRTEAAYWGLIAAQDGMRVAEKSLETANALLSQTQAQYEVGVVSRVEVVQAEAGVADREFELIVRRQSHERAGRAGRHRARSVPRARVRDHGRSDGPARRDERARGERGRGHRHAMARRPEIQLAREQIERREVEVKAAGTSGCRSSTRSGATASGLAGRASPDRTSRAPRPARRTRSTWPTERFVGSQRRESADSIRRPLDPARKQHRAPTAREGRARIAPRRDRAARLEQSIVSEIRRAGANLVASVQGIEAADRAEAAAAEQLRAERVRLEHGESTPFDVLLREEDLVQAQCQKILAQKTYHNSIRPDRAQGTILERNKLSSMRHRRCGRLRRFRAGTETS